MTGMGHNKIINRISTTAETHIFYSELNFAGVATNFVPIQEGSISRAVWPERL